MQRYLTIIEHQEFSEKDVGDRQAFRELEAFAQDNQNKFLIYSRHGYLKAVNYVGVIRTSSGFVLEILPKITKDFNIQNVKRTFLKMLRTLKTFPFSTFYVANLNTENLPLLEIFITMFIDEVERLVKKGIKSEYVTQDVNRTFLRGKLLFNHQIRYNHISKHHFYTQADEYLPLRIENQIIKTTLVKLYRITNSLENQLRLRQLLFIFDQIPEVQDIQVAFSKVRIDRTIKHYDLPLKWSKVFLLNQSFTPFIGKTVSYALLFDMNWIFESYVAAALKNNKELCQKLTGENRCKLFQQHHMYYLFDRPPVYRLIPDIVINDGQFIIDTKWKIIGDRQDISQSDLYQIFAYASKYSGCKAVYLLYPYVEFSQDLNYNFRVCDTNVEFHTLFYDLEKDTLVS